MKRVVAIHGSPEGHWVGDGFPVRSLFSYHSRGAELSPFLLLDHAGPAEFAPAKRPRGVGEHPHRGFETVTIVYQGEVEHRDSAGNGGRIGPGDVQWMTAAAGLTHEEFHSQAFTKRGGAGRVRVIAGEYGGVRGPAITFTPVNVWDVRLNAASSLALTVPEGHTTLIALLRGSLNVNGTDDVAGPGIVQLDRAGVD